ncbi:MULTISPECIES: thioredoxin family protein [Niastella]|uniref:Thioredoxin fold domain-containing protein n=1 Tax=Niastella soli TaxID=2821487 RepID=A0ABS3Z3A7_9BACT|nr:thioredoxin fold domain-containing protein [Niastella soli]MBO9204652.1 thioredoxin fold domain-containing protein [Niastella soli]
MKLLLLLIVIFPHLVAFPQNKTNKVNWKSDSDWVNLRKEALTTNRYIFVDCIASWCLPCKQMDQKVYSKEVVINALKPLIPIKLRIDTIKTKNIKSGMTRNAANGLSRQYHIEEFPTFLFFSPTGELVHKSIGYKNVDQFLQLIQNGIDSSKQYYTLKKKYEVGTIALAAIPYLAQCAREVGDTSFANSAACKYIDSYLTNNPEKLFTRDNLGFIRDFIHVIHSGTKIFPELLANASKADTISGDPAFSSDIIDYVVWKEQIKPPYDSSKISGKEPAWTRLTENIRAQYGEVVADRNVLSAKLNWFSFKKDWRKEREVFVQKVEKYGLDTSGFKWVVTNNKIWKLFVEHVSDMAELTRAISWMEIIKKDHVDPSIIDTYANLLYKAGKFKEAIQWETKAAAVESDLAQADNRPYDETYEQTLHKMETRQLTWD